MSENSEDKPAPKQPDIHDVVPRAEPHESDNSFDNAPQGSHAQHQDLQDVIPGVAPADIERGQDVSSHAESNDISLQDAHASPHANKSEIDSSSIERVIPHDLAVISDEASTDYERSDIIEAALRLVRHDEILVSGTIQINVFV